MKVIRWITCATAASGFAVTASFAQMPTKPSLPPAHQVRIKVDWVTAPPVSTRSLTLTTTDGQVGTVSLEANVPSTDAQSITVQPHVNRDHSITVYLDVVLKQGGASQHLQTVRTFQEGERLILGGLTAGMFTYRIFATVSETESADKPFSLPTRFVVAD